MTEDKIIKKFEKISKSIPLSDWYDALVEDPKLAGWYNVDASNLSPKAGRLFWSGIRWLHRENGKFEFHLKAASFAKWQGISSDCGLSFVAEKRKKKRL
jgi:hypothetical protein